MSNRKRIKLPQSIEGYPVYVEMGYAPVFVCVVAEGHEVTKSSWEALQTAIQDWDKRRRKKKREKFEPIPLLFWEDGEILPTNATGIHAGTGNPLVKIDGHKPQQVSGYSASYLVPMDESEQRYLIALYRTAEKAHKLFKESYEKVKIDHLGDWVKEKAGES